MQKKEIQAQPMSSVEHLYVHIPFCPHICPYCSFYVLTAHRSKADLFLKNLLLEHSTIIHDLNPQTIFIGGGTPTALSTEMLGEMLSHLLKGLDSLNLEISMECNPSTLSRSKADVLQRSGVNRLSIGAQSFDPVILKTLGRTHSSEAIRSCVQTARDSGFHNINLDLIFGVPGQTLESWKTTLHEALRLEPTHLSCYGLTYEEDTPFFVKQQRGELKTDHELEHEMFLLTEEILSQHGFLHYEISNYALKGHECLHNLGYWRGNDFYGIGPSAVSTIRGVRQRNGKLDTTCSWTKEEVESLSKETLAGERMALGLRTHEGIDECAFEKKFGFIPSRHWNREISELTGLGLLELRPSLNPAFLHLRLSGKGLSVADEIAVRFV